MLGQAERLIELKNMNSGQTRKDKSKVIAFTSGKGGTGKTFVSLNLAYAFSRQNKKILFIDLDSNLSNANIMINVVATKTIYSYFTGKSLLADTITEYEQNLHFIFGDSGKADYPLNKPEQINRLFQQIHLIEKDYDFVFIDTGAGANEEIVSILLNSDINIIITSPEPTAVMDAYVILKLLNTGNYAGSKSVLVNKCSNFADGESTFNNLAAAAGHFLKEKLNLLGTLDYDSSVGKAIINQELFLKKEPRSKIAAQLLVLSKSLQEFIHMANIHHTQKARK